MTLQLTATQASSAPGPPSLPPHVLPIPFVLLADGFHDFDVLRRQRMRSFHGPRLFKGARIVHGDLDLQVAQIRPPEALGHALYLGLRKAVEADPGEGVQSNRVDRQRVSFPAPDGMA